LTYRQAAELTWPQLMHALGIEPDLIALESARIVERQNEIFDRIRIRRRCLAVELLRIPTMDLIGLVKAEMEGQTPAAESLRASLARYVAGKS
jgi:hypothetical protein